MKKLALTLILAAFLMPLSALAEGVGNIAVHIEGLRNDKGVVRVALFNEKQGFAAKDFSVDKAVQKGTADIKSQSADYTFANVPYGEYAIRLFHDEDNSGKFYTKMFGIPKVEFGFSNNAKAVFGPPTYSQSKFSLGAAELKMTIKMQHIM